MGLEAGLESVLFLHILFSEPFNINIKHRHDNASMFIYHSESRVVLRSMRSNRNCNVDRLFIQPSYDHACLLRLLSDMHDCLFFPPADTKPMPGCTDNLPLLSPLQWKHPYHKGFQKCR
jgi:hypothetical protein